MDSRGGKDGIEVEVEGVSKVEKVVEESWLRGGRGRVNWEKERKREGMDEEKRERERGVDPNGPRSRH
jgi:hypothetical protein